MIRAVADSIFDKLLADFPADRSRNRQEIQEQPMPPLVATFLLNRMALRVDAEIERPSSEWFDARAAGVLKAWDAFHKAVHQHAHIPADEWKRALDEAVHVVMGYLVKPAATLTQFVFRDRPGPLKIDVVQRRMSFFDAYPYLRDIVEGYFERKEVDSITQHQFQELVQRVDRKMVEHYGPDEWVKLLRPLFDFCALLPEAGSKAAIPSDVLRAFFEERHRGEIARRLAREEGRGLEMIDETNLRRIIEEVAFAASPPREEWDIEASRARPPAGQMEPAEDRNQSKSEPPADRPPSDESVPLWKKFAEQRSEQAGQSPPPPPAPVRFETSGDGDTTERTPLWGGVRSADARGQLPPAEKPGEAHFRSAEKGTGASRSEEGGQPLWMRFAKKEAPEPSVQNIFSTGDDVLARLESAVFGSIPEDRRSWYVDHLFDGSTEEYEGVLRQLSTAPSWAAASQIIGREVFQKKQVNIYSEPAIAFTDAVEARFSQPVRK